MQVGAVYPQIELRGEPSAVRRLGLAVEELGFDYLLAYDHVLGAVHADRTPQLTALYRARPVPRSVRDVRLSGRHHRTTPVRHRDPDPSTAPTALVARQAADLDLLSAVDAPRRWNRLEPRRVRSPRAAVSHPRRPQEEQIDCSAGSSQNLSSTSQGDSTESTEPRLCPSRHIPSRSGRGSSEPAYDRTARLADGFIFIGGDITHHRRLETSTRSRTRPRPTSRGLRRGVRCVRKAVRGRRGRDRRLARGRRNPPPRGHHGPRPLFRRRPNRLPRVARNALTRGLQLPPGDEHRHARTGQSARATRRASLQPATESRGRPRPCCSPADLGARGLVLVNGESRPLGID